MYDLKEAYLTPEGFHFWTNAAGDINIPGFGISSMTDENLLPPPAKVLLTDIWTDGAWAQEYVVSCNDRFALAVGFLFDYSWLEDEGLDKNDPKVRKSFEAAVITVAADIDKFGRNVFDTYYGIDSDPDGHEIMLVIDYNWIVTNKRFWKDFSDKMLHFMTNKIYEDVLSRTRGNGSAFERYRRYLECLSGGNRSNKQTRIAKAEQILVDNGIDESEAKVVLQALGYALLDTELYLDDSRLAPKNSIRGTFTFTREMAEIIADAAEALKSASVLDSTGMYVIAQKNGDYISVDISKNASEETLRYSIFVCCENGNSENNCDWVYTDSLDRNELVSKLEELSTFFADKG